MRTQVAKYLEHYFASNGRPQVGSNMTAANQLPSPVVSVARIAEMRGSMKSGASKCVSDETHRQSVPRKGWHFASVHVMKDTDKTTDTE
jgi:hypothetical protein